MIEEGACPGRNPQTTAFCECRPTQPSRSFSDFFDSTRNISNGCCTLKPTPRVSHHLPISRPSTQARITGPAPIDLSILKSMHRASSSATLLSIPLAPDAHARRSPSPAPAFEQYPATSRVAKLISITEAGFLPRSQNSPAPSRPTQESVRPSFIWYFSTNWPCRFSGRRPFSPSLARSISCNHRGRIQGSRHRSTVNAPPRPMDYVRAGSIP